MTAHDIFWAAVLWLCVDGLICLAWSALPRLSDEEGKGEL
jgi:hypothetical protein